MPFKRYVEIGRVCLINFGEDYGKLVIISDIVDQNRVSCYARTSKHICFFVFSTSTVAHQATINAVHASRTVEKELRPSLLYSIIYLFIFR